VFQRLGDLWSKRRSRHQGWAARLEFRCRRHHVEDDYDWLNTRFDVDDETMTVMMRASAYLDLARVECRERGVLLFPTW